MLDKNKLLEEAIKNALKEDIGEGDHSSLACISKIAESKAKLIVKDLGVLAGVEIAELVFSIFGDFTFKKLIEDGVVVKPGDIVFEVEGSSQGILACERLVLNIMQRMSGIATKTHSMLKLIEGCSTKILDTRKTTPNFRVFEKEAVRIGGGINHRFALYDMIMLKDNHIDYAGGITQALLKTDEYLKNTGKKIKVEIEVRDFKELSEALECGLFNRVMLDNFTPLDISKALKLIDGKYETEASGGITETTLRSYAETGIDYISVGSLTHQITSLDLSLKAF